MCKWAVLAQFQYQNNPIRHLKIDIYTVLIGCDDRVTVKSCEYGIFEKFLLPTNGLFYPNIKSDKVQLYISRSK